MEIPAWLPMFDVYAELPLSARGPLRLRTDMVRRLYIASKHLPAGFGLTVLDGHRTMDFQQELLDYYTAEYPELGDGYVSDPSDAESVNPPHCTGGAMDLTLNWDGVPLALGTDFDAFDDAAHPDWFENHETDSVARDLRRLLSYAMNAAGFVQYPLEWWHWSYGDQWWAAERETKSALYGIVEV